ncbi:MAG: Acetoacetyl-coenzyme A synthetase [Candidatus Magnetoglobus multicellularis str. Araruama]|uniref:Acetoacetyl-coenzyme A synthetase n=1 Tax=Candidatus Magnetoglobus multicellularis str. Araruama TaxID=890399 RepID=A0A1V1PC72_9BACT|nr:MAG: Acetoacetyl-coenzyme A synthetase [Candidatus Magnetoglobus multicellularis str. Araruama]
MAKILWQPNEGFVGKSNMSRFMQQISHTFHVQFPHYSDFYEWSITHIPEFWEQFLQFAKITTRGTYQHVVDDISRMPGAKWFEGLRLNFAENLLGFQDDHTAIIFQGEARPPISLTYKHLYQHVARLAHYLRETGIGPGDRVAAYMPNIPETIIAMLAATSIGATWSSCSPDFGEKGVMDRFGQIQPKILFTCDGYIFKNKIIDLNQRLKSITSQLKDIAQIIVVPYTDSEVAANQIHPRAVNYEHVLQSNNASTIEFESCPFDHPLYIMYSSGTTGLPKCMVQSAGGILLNQLKEMILHTDIKRDDTIFYFTTCGWMMWNWLTSALATGASIVLYDGHPFFPDAGILWEMTQNLGITVFGTSAGYLAALEKSGMIPKEKYNLENLRTILSTGSPLSDEGFEFVYGQIKDDVQLASISGGTDLNGCFALGNPLSPVYCGELQGRGLAMKVDCFDTTGQPIRNQKGELVCTAPFPSMPIYFWNDPDGKHYHKAYFDVFPGIWRHGDFIEIRDNGGVVIYGRSDATLNPGGVRIGTSDIYRIVEQMDEIKDSIVVGQEWDDSERVVLFVQMADGHILDKTIVEKIRKAIRAQASPRHVPAIILDVPGIPYTLNMKKVELAVKKIIHNQPVTNKDALANAEILTSFANRPELKEK